MAQSLLSAYPENPSKRLFLSEQWRTLVNNGWESAADPDASCLGKRPVVKIFTPDASATWLFIEVDADGEILFGLCDLGLGSPELGCVSIRELISVR